MTTTAAPVRLLSVLVNGARHDLAVPANLRLSELVGQAGLRPDDPELTVTSVDGRALALDDVIGEVIADGGTVLLGTDSELARLLATPAPASRPRDRRDGWRQDGLLALAGALIAAQLAATLLLNRREYPVLTDTGRSVAGVLGILLALAIALGAARRVRPEPAHAISGLAGFAAGFTFTVDPSGGRIELAVLVGALGCALVSTVGRTLRIDRTEVASVLLVLSIAVALGYGFALQVGGSLRVPSALLLGLVPAVYRLLPSYSIDVPDEQLIDIRRLSVTAWTPRTTRRPATRRVRLADVEQRVAHAQRLMNAAVGALAVAAAGTAGVVLKTSGTGFSRWGAVTEVALVALALALLPRTARSVAEKVVPRAAAAALLIEICLLVTARTSTAGAGLLAAVLLGCGLVAMLSAAAIAGGWLSVRISRLADLLESVAVVLALPAGLIAVEAISTFRQLTSG